MMSLFSFIGKTKEFFTPTKETSRRIKNKKIKKADEIAKDLESFTKTLLGVAWQVLGFVLVVIAIVIAIFYMVQQFM